MLYLNANIAIGTAQKSWYHNVEKCHQKDDKNPEKYGFKLEKSKIDDHLERAGRMSLRIKEEQIVDGSWAQVCKGCKSVCHS